MEVSWPFLQVGKCGSCLSPSWPRSATSEVTEGAGHPQGPTGPLPECECFTLVGGCVYGAVAWRYSGWALEMASWVASGVWHQPDIGEAYLIKLSSWPEMPWGSWIMGISCRGLPGLLSPPQGWETLLLLRLRSGSTGRERGGGPRPSVRYTFPAPRPLPQAEIGCNCIRFMRCPWGRSPVLDVALGSPEDRGQGAGRAERLHVPRAPRPVAREHPLFWKKNANTW